MAQYIPIFFFRQDQHGILKRDNSGKVNEKMTSEGMVKVKGANKRWCSTTRLAFAGSY